MFNPSFHSFLIVISSLVIFLSAFSPSHQRDEHELFQLPEEGAQTPRFAEATAGFLGNLAQGALMGAVGGATGLPVGSPLGAPVATPFAAGVPTAMEAPGTAPAGVPGAAAGTAPVDAPMIPPVDLDAVDATQKQIDEEIESATKLGNKLKEAVDMLSATTQSQARKGVEYSATVVQPPPPPEDQTGIEMAANEAPQESLYTAPVIVLLPPEPSPSEKMEFARAMACLGKMNSPEMRKARSAELQEMATIKGKTEEELQREISAAQEALTKAKADRRRVQEELRQVASNAISGAASQADVLFLKHDTHLADEKITVLLDKIRRLEVRLARVRNLEERQTQKEAQEEEETTEEEDEEEGDEDSKWGEAGHHKGGSKKNRKAEKVSKQKKSSRFGKKKKPRFTEYVTAPAQPDELQAPKQMGPREQQLQLNGSRPQQVNGQMVQQVSGQMQKQFKEHIQQQLSQQQPVKPTMQQSYSLRPQQVQNPRTQYSLQEQQIQLADNYASHKKEIEYQHMLQQLQLQKQQEQQRLQQQQLQAQLQKLNEMRLKEEEEKKAAKKKTMLGRSYREVTSNSKDPNQKD